jgi:hypothetical protein
MRKSARYCPAGYLGRTHLYELNREVAVYEMWEISNEFMNGHGSMTVPLKSEAWLLEAKYPRCTHGNLAYPRLAIQGFVHCIVVSERNMKC